MRNVSNNYNLGHCFDLSKYFNISSFIDLKSENDKKNELNKLNIKCKTYKSKIGQEYLIFNYDKNYLSTDSYSTLGLYRSVIVLNNQIVSFAPPKCIQLIDFEQNSMENGDSSNIITEELIEGTMINLFWSKADPLPRDARESGTDVGDACDRGYWELSTRGTVGGNSSFFKNGVGLSFRRMFLEACIEVGLEFDSLDKDFVYSFVLQHPENRIVKPIIDSAVYLVEVYKIEDNNIYPINSNYYKAWNVFLESKVQYPKIYTKPKDELISDYKNLLKEYSDSGIVFKNTVTCERAKFRNPVYEEVKLLRGNQPKLQYQYLSLRKDGHLPQFFKYYPEFKSECNQYKDQLHTYTKALYENYKSCFIKKDKKLNLYPHEFRIHIYNLHQLYLNNYRSKKGFIGFSVVIDYVNKLHVSQQMYVLNYKFKTREVGCIKKLLK